MPQWILLSRWRIWEFLVSRRKELGLTQQDLASRLGIFLEAVSRMERTYYRTVSLGRLIDIAAALQITLLLHGEPTTPTEPATSLTP